jgi:hypothetical protein
VICCCKEGKEKRNCIASGIKMETVISPIYLHVTSSFSYRKLPSQYQGNLSHVLCVWDWVHVVSLPSEIQRVPLLYGLYQEQINCNFTCYCVDVSVDGLLVYVGTYIWDLTIFFFFPWRYSPNLGFGLPPWNIPFHFGLLNLWHSVGLLGWVISSSQGFSTCTQTQKNAPARAHTHKHEH